MRDQFGRNIDYMRVSVTDRCNLRCIYCMPEEGVPCVSHSDILTFDEIRRICGIGAELGISRIKLTGGEPLVRRGLPGLLGMLKKIPGIEQVTLTTNGILLKDNINELVSNGLDAVNISIDTLDPEYYHKITRRGGIEEVLSGLDAALSYPALKVKVNCVPLKGMPEETYVQLASLAKDRDVDVRFIEMMPIGLGKEYFGVSGQEIYNILKERFGEAERCNGKFGNGPAVYVQFSGFQGKIGFIDAVTHKFCSTCNRVRLTSEGRLKLCLQYETGIDMRKLLRSGADDEVIKQEMRRVIYEKPACHHFADGRPDTPASLSGDEKLETRDMSQIGG
ncbi:GTP 3',8-cyclase MoaA [Mediterraneibacter glycyrrhizinilyticus]|uniref:GTP 3',8-cyclase MoaA n=1 Tax=Mediterraneibacter glycyrrhizinilyticus TaxID=342942 RepID=UPI00265A942C|nr:GTP 3',8-cyclase MoaA [Mediterraneibacter glycyrrhizinilyticus]MCF2569628.1 GTP 3',8-cyclase MoaA [Mediterraneibacter glycyrrhizinilyticus]